MGGLGKMGKHIILDFRVSICDFAGERHQRRLFTSMFFKKGKCCIKIVKNV